MRNAPRRLASAGACLAIAAGFALAPSPAVAATTVKVQLGITGVTTAASPIGGSIVGIHPGDSVSLSPATVPTVGLDKIPTLSGLLAGLNLDLLTGYQVVLHLPDGFPGGKRDVKLGACGGLPKLDLAFPGKGVYNFTWTAHQISPLCLLPSNLGSLYGNQLKPAGVALNAKADWVATIVVSDNPPKGGLGVQLPGISVAPSVPVLGQLPTIGVPNVVLPTLGVPGAALPTAPAPVATPAAKPAAKPAGEKPFVRGAAYSGRDFGLLFPAESAELVAQQTAVTAPLPKQFVPLTVMALLALLVVSSLLVRTRRPATVRGRHSR